MLFNSEIFIFGFLPVTLVMFFVAGRINHRLAAVVLLIASIVFYSWWNRSLTFLLLASIAFNYAFGVTIGRSRAAGRPYLAKSIMTAGIVADLAVLAYYKYAGFLISSFGHLTGSEIALPEIVLPLGISFFTFTQIAFLADTGLGEVREYNPIHYALFVTFFPHLIAGPIIHHKEIMPQFARPSTYRLNWSDIAVGSTIFIGGLFKKVMLADNVGVFARLVFDAPGGTQFSFSDAWIGVLAYALQIYFDFSGYSDMAVGLARMFGIKLPINFNSPYKALNIIDFWRRWHMTLTRFVTDYVYNPLIVRSARRRGKYWSPPSARNGSLADLMRTVAFPTLLTMILIGMWHGAGWQYLIFGTIHGVYILINRAWRHFACHRLADRALGAARAPIYCLLTFLCVCMTFPFFRSSDVATALGIAGAMLGVHGVNLANANLPVADAVFRIAPLLAVVWAAPNIYQMMADAEPALVARDGIASAWIRWRPTVPTAVICGLAGVACVPLLHRASEFLYFQF